jgi:hypothetical protein
VELSGATLAFDQGLPVARLQLAATRPVEEPLTVFAQLLASDGTLWAQADHGFPPQRWNDTRGVSVRMGLVPFRGSPPADLRLIAGVYRQTPDGPRRLSSPQGDTVDLGTIHVDDWGPEFAPSGHGAVPFGVAMTLQDVAVHRTTDTLVVDLSWLAEQAYVSDYTVSVQVEGDGWKAQSDGTPALGMLPTLKWLPGMRVHDRHRIVLPEDMGPDSAFQIRLTVYDAFTLEPLPVTDRARAQRGEGQATVVYASEVAP